MANKPTKLMAGFGLNADTMKTMADQQQRLLEPVPDGIYEVRIRTASVFTKSEDGEQHEYPAFGLMYDFVTEPGQKGSSYLQFRPKERKPGDLEGKELEEYDRVLDAEIAVAMEKFGMKMSALFGATDVDLAETMNSNQWSVDEKRDGRKAVLGMKGVFVRFSVVHNSFTSPRDGVSRGYHLKFITKMTQPESTEPPASIFKKGK